MQCVEWRGTWPSPVVRGRGRRRRDVKDDKTIIPFCARTRHEGQVPRPRDPPCCASVPPTPTRGIIRNNPKSMSLQLADIRRPACECRSVPMTGSHENCRKRKKEGDLCGGEWASYPANITEWHTRGSAFGTGQLAPHHRPPPSPRPIFFCEARRKLPLLFF